MTNLVITGLNLPVASVRGATQSLEPIDSATQIKRTVNGTAIDISDPIFRKYKSTIQCEDQLPPAFNGIWPGIQLEVSCISELSYLTIGGSPAKTVVSGSSRTDGSFTFYRPKLSMILLRYTFETDEYSCVVNWSMDLEEV